ncbi:sorbose reductase activity protein [[Candida] boidinii]|nr:sorbose reductase activity protein [[Candida] boidinii]
MSQEKFVSRVSHVGDLPIADPVIADNVLDLFSLKGKVASVTGSSMGIGQAVAEAYAQAGADVAIWYNSTPSDAQAKILSAKYGVKCKAYKCQISDFKQVRETIEQIEKDFGKIDIFVANAGVAWDSGAITSDLSDEESYKEWRRIWDLDVDAVYFCSKILGEIFKRQGYGSYIITASISAHIVNVPQFQTPYNAAKAAVKHFAKSLAIEWAGFARVNTVSPGYINTEMVRKLPSHLKGKWYSLVPMGRLGLPKELVGAYLFLASDASTYATGTDIIIDGGYTSV